MREGQQGGKTRIQRYKKQIAAWSNMAITGIGAMIITI
jgi:hypothetical protein